MSTNDRHRACGGRSMVRPRRRHGTHQGSTCTSRSARCGAACAMRGAWTPWRRGHALGSARRRGGAERCGTSRPRRSMTRQDARVKDGTPAPNRNFFKSFFIIPTSADSLRVQSSLDIARGDFTVSACGSAGASVYAFTAIASFAKPLQPKVPYLETNTSTGRVKMQ